MCWKNKGSQPADCEVSSLLGPCLAPPPIQPNTLSFLGLICHQQHLLVLSLFTPRKNMQGQAAGRSGSE